jgi:hypothetical protein
MASKRLAYLPALAVAASAIGFQVSGCFGRPNLLTQPATVYHRFRTISFCLEAMSSNVKGLAGPSRR